MLNNQMLEQLRTKCQSKLDKLNSNYFKDNFNAIPFCINCDLKNRQYCNGCATKQINKLNNFLLSTEIAIGVYA